MANPAVKLLSPSPTPQFTLCIPFYTTDIQLVSNHEWQRGRIPPSAQDKSRATLELDEHRHVPSSARSVQRFRHTRSLVPNLRPAGPRSSGVRRLLRRSLPHLRHSP